jgi:hypothetical protein
MATRVFTDLGDITAPDIGATGPLTINVQTGDYTLAPSDANTTYLDVVANGNVTVMIPKDVLAVGDTVPIEQGGTGSVTISGADDVTLNFYSPSSATACVTVGAHALIQLAQTAENVWTAAGGIA